MDIAINPVTDATLKLKATKRRLQYVGVPFPLVDILSKGCDIPKNLKNKIKRFAIDIKDNVSQYAFSFSKGAQLAPCYHNHWELIVVFEGMVIEGLSGKVFKAGDYIMIPPKVKHHIFVKDNNSFFYADFANDEKLFKLPEGKKVHLLDNNKGL